MEVKQEIIDKAIKDKIDIDAKELEKIKENLKDIKPIDRWKDLRK